MLVNCLFIFWLLLSLSLSLSSLIAPFWKAENTQDENSTMSFSVVPLATRVDRCVFSTTKQRSTSIANFIFLMNNNIDEF